MEQEGVRAAELRDIASAVRALQERAKRAGESTLAYLLDMAGMEADARARRGAGNDEP